MDLPASMYINYLERRKADHARLTEALTGQNGIDDFKTVGHQIKGNATSFGFDDLVAIGEQMERLSIPLNAAAAKSLLSEFQLWIEKTEKRLIEQPPTGAES